MPKPGHGISARQPGLLCRCSVSPSACDRNSSNDSREFLPRNSERILMHDSSRGLFGLVSAIICAGFCVTLVTGAFPIGPLCSWASVSDFGRCRSWQGPEQTVQIVSFYNHHQEEASREPHCDREDAGSSMLRPSMPRVSVCDFRNRFRAPIACSPTKPLGWPYNCPSGVIPSSATSAPDNCTTTTSRGIGASRNTSTRSCKAMPSRRRRSKPAARAMS